MLKELVLRNRSYRRFHEEAEVDGHTLRELVDLARLSASARNRQPLKYVLSCARETNELIFPHLGWAGYLAEWSGPVEGERPSAYIIVLGDKEIVRSFSCDHGISAQTILLGATEQGLGGCIIASIQRNELRKALNIPWRYEILLVIALGRPKETVILEEAGSDGKIEYWRDENGVHHVPKRPLGEIIIG